MNGNKGAWIGGLLILGAILFFVFLGLFFGPMLFVVHQGEVAVRFDPWGQYPIQDKESGQWVTSSIRPEEYGEGIHVKAVWVSIDRFNVKTQDYTMSSAVEEGQVEGSDAIRAVTSEGLYVDLDITVLYRADFSRCDEIRRDIGEDGDYQDIVVRPTIRSIIREVISKYEAVDVYGEKRIVVESEIQDTLVRNLEHRGIKVERTLLRSVGLPPQLVFAIEEKKKAEQEAQRMEYVLVREELEKDRKIIEAGGIAKAQEIINRTITDEYLKWWWLEKWASIQNQGGTVIYVPIDNAGFPIIKDVDNIPSKE